MQKRSKEERLRKRLSLQSALIEKEKQWNLSTIKLKKTIYANKHHLKQENIYNKAFHFLNERIKLQVEMHDKDAITRNDADDKFYQIKKYDTIYNNNSQKLVKFIKSKNSKSLESNKLDNSKVLKKVRSINIKRREPNRVFSKFKEQSKVFNHNPKFKFDMNYQKLSKKLRSKFSLLQNKLTISNRNILASLLPKRNQKEYKREKTFSKKAYLASLNYNFKDPFLIP